jgi:hypothetical protein
MEALLAFLANELKADPTLSGYAVAWLVLNAWGLVALCVAYRSRIKERAAMVNPPRHLLFPPWRFRK